MGAVESGSLSGTEAALGGDVTENGSFPNTGIVGNAGNDALPDGDVVDRGEATIPISFPAACGDTVGIAPSAIIGAALGELSSV